MTISFLYDQVRARSFEPLVLSSPIDIAQLPTPALVLDRAKMLSNIERMRTELAMANKGFRPHAKTHKCPQIAKLQLDAGAVGICVAKISEAVAMAAAGVSPILITSPLTTREKVALVNKLVGEGTEIGLVVDSETGIDLLAAQITGNSTVNVFIDLDVAMGRTGIRDDDLVAKIYAKVAAQEQLHFSGFQHYAGHVMHISGYDARAKASLELWHQITQRLIDLGLPYDVLTGGGTGTYDIDREVAAITDLQVGSYIFMDEEYRQIGSKHAARFEDFQVSLTIACTAISRPMANCITFDGGYKAMASDTVPPVTDDFADTKYRFAGDEHGVLIGKASSQSVKLGDVVRLVTPHCDPTVNLHDYFWVLEDDGQVHSCWPITGRGCTW